VLLGDRHLARVEGILKRFGAGAGTHDAEEKPPAMAGATSNLKMRQEEMRRQGATSKGLRRRLGDLGFNKVHEPRVAAKVDYSMELLLSTLVVAMVTMARSLRDVESRTLQIARNPEAGLGITTKVADNTFGKVLPRVDHGDLVACLHRMVKAEHRRGNLKPTVLPVGTVAIDGKNVATLRWHDLCRVLELKQTEAEPEQVKALLAERYPDVQFCQPEHSKPYALARVHTVTLISSDAGVCIHQRSTLGHTNEIGSMPALLDELHAGYGRSVLITMVTTDAGNTSLKVAGLILGHGWDYFLQIKSEHGDLFTEATAALGSLPDEEARWSDVDIQNGKVVTYRVWQHDLTDEGWLNWSHARQLVRIKRTVEDPQSGEVKEGNRFYVSNKKPSELRAKGCGKLSRAHWRCENETHWTADAEIQEDRRRLSWSRHPKGVFVVSVLRRIAANILAVTRKLSRLGHSLETPTWHQVAEHFLLVLCVTILETEAFDAEIR
jgi:predicted transposase YbfD/YdcC